MKDAIGENVEWKIEQAYYIFFRTTGMSVMYGVLFGLAYMRSLHLVKNLTEDIQGVFITLGQAM